MTAATLGRWGNSLAIRIPANIADAAKISAGDPVEIDVAADAITIRAAAPRFTAKSLFEGRTAAEWRNAYAGAYDWGPDLGREILPK
jgi:antitoxin MazE